MKTLPREEALEEWNAIWDKAHKEFFKVETLQHYLGEEKDAPGVKEFLEGDKEKGIEKLKQSLSEENEWVKHLREQRENKSKLKFIRIHVVEEPYHPHLEWEIEHYKLINIPLGGEKIYLVNKKDVSPSVIETGDFMMFDQLYVADSEYSSEGRLESMTFYDQEDDISKFLSIREELISKADSILN